MKKKLFFVAVLVVSTCLSAQVNNNPFAKYGYKKQIMYTSSKGEFEEFHDQADIVEIGSALFNTKTNQVVGFVSEEKENADVASATTAMSIDPLCEKYYWITPYAYCLDNPVNMVDQDGRQAIPFPMPVPPPPVSTTTISPSDVRNAINSLRQSVRTTFQAASNLRLSVGGASIGGGASILIVMPVAKPSPGKQEQDKRDRDAKNKLDQNQANVQQTVVSGGHNPQDPGGDFNPNNPKPSTVVKVVAGAAAAGVTVEQISTNGDSDQQQTKQQPQQQQTEQKPQQQDPSIWDRIKNFFK